MKIKVNNTEIDTTEARRRLVEIEETYRREHSVIARTEAYEAWCDAYAEALLDAVEGRESKPKIQPSEVLSYTAKETAAIIRADLKREFPGTKFSVLVGRAAMNSSVEVSWEKGPTQTVVEAVVGKYATYEGYYGDDGKWDCNRPIEIDTPEGKRLAHFVNSVHLRRRKWL